MDYERITRQQLLRAVRELPEHLPISGTLPWPRYYNSHREHWTLWLGEYDGPGYYGRRCWDRNARFIYNHINNVPMLIWLAEGADVECAIVADAMRYTSPAHVRMMLPWGRVAYRLFG